MQGESLQLPVNKDHNLNKKGCLKYLTIKISAPHYIGRPFWLPTIRPIIAPQNAIQAQKEKERACQIADFISGVAEGLHRELY